MSGAPAHLPCRPLRLVESRRIAGRGFNVTVAGGSDEDPLIAKDAMNGAQPQGPRRPMNEPPAWYFLVFYARSGGFKSRTVTNLKTYSRMGEIYRRMRVV